MERKKEIVVMLMAFCLVIGFELLMHWFLASNATLRALYLSGKKTNSTTGIVDNTIPAAMLGLVNGWIGYKWTIRRLCFAAVLFAGGIVGSQALYRLFFKQEHLLWWPPHVGETIYSTMTALIVLGVFTYQGRILAAWRAAGYPKVRP